MGDEIRPFAVNNNGAALAEVRLRSLHHNRGVGEQAHVTDVVAMGVRYCNTTNITWLQPDFGELIRQRLI
jgi:hypothetical protein